MRVRFRSRSRHRIGEFASTLARGVDPASVVTRMAERFPT
jgi:hypothetical protein